jgi:hypothetical protein
MGSSLNTHPDLRFRDSPSTHFARFVLVADEARGDRLVFTSNYDGSAAGYAEELLKTTGRAMDQIWSLCSGYHPGDALQLDSWSQFIKTHRYKEQMFFVSHPGVSSATVRRNATLRSVLEQILDGTNPALFHKLATLLSANVRDRSASLGNAKIPVWIGRALEWLVGIDAGHSNPNTILRNPPHVSMLEDAGTHNALTVVAPIKRGLLPRLILRLVLFAGALSVQKAWGSLSGITSIHFARWMILDGGRTLLFESNYNGSWESYIDEFVDVSSAGLNAIWANCIGFPARGCRDIESFKDVIRKHQHPALMFYCAYPASTVKNVIADHCIGRAFKSFLDSGDASQVLAGSCETMV